MNIRSCFLPFLMGGGGSVGIGTENELEDVSEEEDVVEEIDEIGDE